MNINTKQRLHSMAGYTLDQTILIVAVIAILVTIIIGSLGWELLGRAGGTKLASHLRQIEAANGEFYSKYSMWPIDAAVSGKGMLVLAGDDGALDEDKLTLASGETLKNYLPTYEKDADDVKSPFGRGGTITMSTGTYEGQDYIIVTFTNVPMSEAENADEAIDGKGATDRKTTGRVHYGDNGSKPVGSSSSTTLEFYANVIN